MAVLTRDVDGQNLVAIFLVRVGPVAEKRHHAVHVSLLARLEERRGALALAREVRVSSCRVKIQLRRKVSDSHNLKLTCEAINKTDQTQRFLSSLFIKLAENLHVVKLY